MSMRERVLLPVTRMVTSSGKPNSKV